MCRVKTFFGSFDLRSGSLIIGGITFQWNIISAIFLILGVKDPSQPWMIVAHLILELISMLLSVIAFIAACVSLHRDNLDPYFVVIMLLIIFYSLCAVVLKPYFWIVVYSYYKQREESYQANAVQPRPIEEQLQEKHNHQHQHGSPRRHDAS